MVKDKKEVSFLKLASFDIGESCRYRTCDPQIKSLLLYQLS